MIICCLLHGITDRGNRIADSGTQICLSRNDGGLPAGTCLAQPRTSASQEYGTSIFGAMSWPDSVTSEIPCCSGRLTRRALPGETRQACARWRLAMPNQKWHVRVEAGPGGCSVGGEEPERPSTDRRCIPRPRRNGQLD